MVLTCTRYHSRHITEGRQRPHCGEKFVFTVCLLSDGESSKIQLSHRVDKRLNDANH